MKIPLRPWLVNHASVAASVSNSVESHEQVLVHLGAYVAQKTCVVMAHPQQHQAKVLATPHLHPPQD